MYRLSGLSLIIGMLLSIVTSIASGVLFSDTSNPAVATDPLNIALGVCGVLGTALALFGLPALYARSASAGGVLWLLGVVTIALMGMLFGIFLGFLGVIVFPALATEAPNMFAEGPPPAFLVVFILGTVLNVLGAVSMAIPMFTKQLYPRWCAYLMLLAAVLALVSFFLNGLARRHRSRRFSTRFHRCRCSWCWDTPPCNCGRGRRLIARHAQEWPPRSRPELHSPPPVEPPKVASVSSRFGEKTMGELTHYSGKHSACGQPLIRQGDWSSPSPCAISWGCGQATSR